MHQLVIKEGSVLLMHGVTMKFRYRIFPGGKVRPRLEADPSPPSSAEVKNRVELRSFVAYERVKPTYLPYIFT